MNKTLIEVLKIAGSGIGGVILTLFAQRVFPVSQEINLTINGEEVTITQSDYTELYNQNIDLQSEIEDLTTKLDKTKEELSIAESSLSEAEEKVTTLSSDMPKFEYSDLGINIEGTVGNNYAKGYLNIDGRNFILLDAIQDIVGKDVSYEENVLYVGHTTAEKVYLMDVCPPYDVSSYNRYSTEQFKMAGTDYKGFSMRLYGGYAQYVLINLNNQFSSLELDFGHVDGSEQSSCILNIYLDGNLVETLEQQPDSDVYHVNVPLNYGRHLKFELLKSYNDAIYGFGNIELQY